jgi:hypothetical protein
MVEVEVEVEVEMEVEVELVDREGNRELSLTVIRIERREFLLIGC